MPPDVSTSVQVGTASRVPDGFASTSWSLVLAAATEGGAELDRLCRAYWRPVYLYIRSSGFSASDAEDATQDFFADMLKREWLKDASHERGSFRAFLMTYLRNFQANRWRREHAQKRGAEAETISLDSADCEKVLAGLADTAGSATEIYERSWAGCLLQAALTRLEQEQPAAARMRFQKFRPFLTLSPVPGDYARLASELELPKGQVALLIHRLSRRFQDLIRHEVAQTMIDRSDVEAELRYLLRVVSK